MSGFIWYTNALYEAINADWEAYPIGYGWESALNNLSWFAPDTKFYKIDDIDTAILFVAKEPKTLRKEGKDPHSPHYYHISIWHKDLIALHDQGFVNGIQPLTDYEYQKLWFKQRTEDIGIFVDEHNFHHYPDGSKVLGFKRPKEDEHDNEDHIWVDIPKGYIQLSQTGIDKINEPIVDFNINEDVQERINPLLNIGYYDSAVREASILFELKLKEINNSSLFGQKLVDLHYKNICDKFGGTDSYLKYYRGLLRCSINFIRNEYAHDFPITSENRAKRLIQLYSKLYEITDELVSEK